MVKIGLMLGGGGARGTYQLGVIRALEEAHFLKYVKVISGTSIGAINAMLLMSKKNHKRMSEIWSMIEDQNVFADKKAVFKEKRIYSLEPLAKTLLEKINQAEIKKSKYQGYATASLMYSKDSLIHQLKTDTMEKKVFHLNGMKEPYLGVLASASIPVLFGPTQIDGQSYVDGGLLDNHPIQPLIDAGCNLIFAIALEEKFNPYIYDHTDINIIDFTAHKAFTHSPWVFAIDMLKFHEQFKDDLEELGYVTGKIMIQKIYDEKFVNKFLWTYRWHKQSDFKVLNVSEDDEKYIREIKIKLKKRKKIKMKQGDEA